MRVTKKDLKRNNRVYPIDMIRFGSMVTVSLGVALLVSLGVALLGYQTIYSSCQHDSNVDPYLPMSSSSSALSRFNSVDKLSSSTLPRDDYLSTISGSGALDCVEAPQRVERSEWHDPNQGRLFVRQIVTEPHFWVSVHNQTYDAVRWQHIYEKGEYYETDVRSRFLSILSDQPASLVLDVGANIGYYTLLSAALGHRVIGFEINPANLLRICESLRLNDWNHGDRVAIFQRGVSNTHGSTLQVLVPKNPGQAYMKDLDPAEKSNETSTHHAFTTTVTLDDFAADRGWFARSDLSIAILKLDVEGKEPQIIEGARKLLESGIVKNILTEFRRLGRETIQTAIRTMLDSGYTLVHDSRRRSRVESEQILSDLEKELHGKMRNVDLWFQRP